MNSGRVLRSPRHPLAVVIFAVFVAIAPASPPLGRELETIAQTLRSFEESLAYRPPAHYSLEEISLVFRHIWQIARRAPSRRTSSPLDRELQALAGAAHEAARLATLAEPFTIRSRASGVPRLAEAHASTNREFVAGAYHEANRATEILRRFMRAFPLCREDAVWPDRPLSGESPPGHPLPAASERHE